MQYADVAIKAKTGQEDVFTYQIPAKYLGSLNKGSLVEVPFGQQKLLGVIINFRKRLTNLDDKKLKEIIKIIDPTPVLDPQRLKLAKQLSNYYLTSLGKMIFAMISPVARRQTPNDFQAPLKIKKGEGSTSLINGPLSYRAQKYQEIIEQTLSQNNQVIYLSSSLNSSLSRYLRKKFKNHTLYHTGLTRSKKYQIWQRAQKGKLSLIIGTRQALFLPLSKLETVIIEDSTNDLYKSEQEPFYDTRKAALSLAKRLGLNLYLGSLHPWLNHYYKYQNRNYNWQQKKSPTKTNSRIINLNQEKGLLSLTLKKEVEKTLEKTGKVGIYLNRKGGYRLLVCQDCQEVELIQEKKTPTRCSKCSSSKIKMASIGTRGLKKQLQEEYPEAMIRVLDGQTKQKTLDKVLNKKFDILIGTNRFLYYNFNFKLMGIILPEIPLSFPHYYIWEKTFYHLSQTSQLADKTLVQTFYPNHPLIGQAVNGKWEDFYHKEIKRRKENNEPPFASYLKIYTRQKDPRKKLNQIRKKIKKWTDKSGQKPEISPTITSSLIDRPYFLIKTQSKIPQNLKKFLKKLGNIKIDRDSRNLG